MELAQTYFRTWDDYVDYYFRWTVNWHDCNMFCYAYLGFEVINLLFHWYVNMIQLRGWAEGSILLIGNTYYTTLMTLFATMLLLGVPNMMMAPYTTRMGIFSFAVFSVVTFLT